MGQKIERELLLVRASISVVELEHTTSPLVQRSTARETRIGREDTAPDPGRLDLSRRDGGSDTQKSAG